MTGNNTNEKLRALFLAFIMVVSVVGMTVALGGSAAATASSLTIDDGELAPGETVSFTTGDGAEDTTEDTFTVWIDEDTDGVLDTGEANTTVTDDAGGSEGDASGTLTAPSSEGTYTLASTEGTSPSTAEQTQTFVVDETSPSFGTVSPNAGSLQGSEPASITVDISESNTLNQSATTVTLVNASGTTLLDGANVADNGNLSWDTPSAGTLQIDLASFTLGDGVTDVTVNAVDEAGNTNSTTWDFGVDTNQVTDNTADATDEMTDVNVTLSSAYNIDESSINVSVTNKDTSKTTDIVVNGDVATGTAQSSATLNDNNETDEVINVSVPLQEDAVAGYSISVDADDTNGNTLDSSSIADPAFTVEMSGQDLKIVPDESNPAAGTNASVAVVAVDKFGNELIHNDTNVYGQAQDIQFTYDDSDNVTYESLTTTGTNGLVNSSGTYQALWDITYSQTGDLTITAQDFGSDTTLTQDSAAQTYSGTVSDLALTADSSELVADGTDTINVTAQILDQNGEPIDRDTAETISFSITNNTAAGVSVASGTRSGAADNSTGAHTLELKATNSGYTVDVTGKIDGKSITDSVSFETTTGDVDATKSTFTYDGKMGTVSGDQVASTHDLYVQLLDPSDNPVEGQDVTLTADGEEITTLTTNATGEVSTTYTLPEQKGTTTLNVTNVPNFNASAEPTATIDVTSEAANASQLVYESDSRTLPSGTQKDVTVAVQDQYGNVNTSYAEEITLESSDTSVVDVVTTPQSGYSDGNVTFTIEANATSGSADLTASTTDDVSNVSGTWSIGSAQAIEVTFDSWVSTSSNAIQQTTMNAQLLDGSGNPIEIQGETIEFARLSGSAAELNQSAGSFTAQTNSSGVATFDVNATSTTGLTEFYATADNFTADGGNSVRTTGGAEYIGAILENETAATNTSVNVSAAFVDSDGYPVPKDNADITLKTDLGTWSNDKQSITVTPTQAQGTDSMIYESVATLNSSETGTANLTFIGAGVSGGAQVEFTAEGEPAGPSPIGDFDNAPTDPDGDGDYEDVNGDGTFDIVDVSAYFQNYQGQGVQDNIDAFDYNGDGEISIVDVNRLFQDSQA